MKINGHEITPGMVWKELGRAGCYVAAVATFMWWAIEPRAEQFVKDKVKQEVAAAYVARIESIESNIQKLERRVEAISEEQQDLQTTLNNLESRQQTFNTLQTESRSDIKSILRELRRR